MLSVGPQNKERKITRYMVKKKKKKKTFIKQAVTRGHGSFKIVKLGFLQQDILPVSDNAFLGVHVQIIGVILNNI